jgi:predicted dehydrogenase
VLGDLGTHPLYLSEVILPDLRIRRLLCTRQSFVKSRAPLEDNAVVLTEYDSGAVGFAWISAVNAGGIHSQKVRIVGSKASLEWWDEHPGQLSFEVQGEPVRILERGMDYLGASARDDDRIGPGHPEGLFESWANLYRRFALAMELADRGETDRLAALRYPDIAAGVAGVRWVEACVRSADQGGVWIDYQ